LFFQRAEESFDAPITFRLPHEGGRRLDAQELDFSLEVVAPVDAAVVVPQSQTRGAAGCESTEILFHSLADGFERFEPVGFLDRMDTHTIAVQ
jgi:hypothetical protein